MEEGESGKGTVVADDLNVDSVGDDLTLLLESVVVSLDQVGESVLSRDEDLLSAGELELGSSQGLLGVGHVFGVGSHGHEHLTDVDSCGLAESLTEGTSHTLLESISSSAGEHLVDSDHMPGVDSHSHVEAFSSNAGLHVLVASNTGSLEGLGGNLLLLVANQMDAGGESVVSSLLLTDVVDSELGVGDSTVESRLGVRLVLLISIAPTRSSAHFEN